MAPEEIDAFVFKIISGYAAVEDKEWCANDFIGNNCKKLCFDQVMPSLWRLFDQDKIELTHNLKFKRKIIKKPNRVSRALIRESYPNSLFARKLDVNHIGEMEEPE